MCLYHDPTSLSQMLYASIIYIYISRPVIDGWRLKCVQSAMNLVTRHIQTRHRAIMMKSATIYITRDPSQHIMYCVALRSHLCRIVSIATRAHSCIHWHARCIAMSVSTAVGTGGRSKLCQEHSTTPHYRLTYQVHGNNGHQKFEVAWPMSAQSHVLSLFRFSRRPALHSVTRGRGL